MGAFNRLLDRVREPTDPIRTIGPVNRSEGLLSSPQAAPQAPRESLLDYMNQWGAYTPMDWQSIAPQLAQLGIDPKGQDGARGWQYNGGNPQHDAGGDTQPWSLTPEAQAKLQGYTLGDASQLDRNAWQRQIYDPSGQAIGQSNEDRSKSMGWIETAVPLALAFMGANAAGSALSGAAGSGASAGAGAASSGGAIGSSVAGAGLEAQAAIEAYLAANPVSMGSLMAGVPEIASITAAAGGASMLPEIFRPALDSQLYNTAAGITGKAAAAASTVPATVNLVNAGGTMATAGGLSGLASLASQGLRDLTASSEIGGGLLSQAGSMGAGALDTVGSGLGTAASWAAKNPGLAKALLGGAGALLSTQGGGSSGGAPKAYGAPVQWKSPVAGIPQGLLGGGQGGQQQGGGYPAAMGLLGGQANSGAWRFLR